MFSRILRWFAPLILLFTTLAQAQIIVVPEPPRHVPPQPIPTPIPIHGSYVIKNVTLDATLKDQIADVQLSQTFRNTGGRDLEVSFMFPVPPDAVVSQLVLMVDGKEIPAKLYTKEEAVRIYESIVRSRRDPALMQYVGYGLVEAKLFPLPANAERKITLKYQQLCKREREVTDFLFPLISGRMSGRPVEELNINVRINSVGKIKSVYSPNYAINVERPDNNSAVVKYRALGVTPNDDFRILWALSDTPVGATILTYRPNENEEGYFLLLASPEFKAVNQAVAAKTVVFCLDRSGSMAGAKIAQARNALKFVLNNLREGDTFNIVTYDGNIDVYKPELQRYNAESRAEAIRYVEGITDGGGTNINGALLKSFELIGNTGRPSYLIFLTDGLPTFGETREAAIAENAKNANKAHIRLFSFGVGFDVNARLLDRLVTDNFGASEYVRPNEDIEASVAKFYGKMAAPVLTNLRIEIPGADLTRAYPTNLPDLFAGGQIIAVGRYRNAGDFRMKLSGKVGEETQAYDFPANMVRKSGDDSYGFIEKLWATRRVGDIINELDLRGKNQELIDELVRLSTKHGILTPYTAFLADENTVLRDYRGNATKARENFFEDKASGLAQNAGGQAGVSLRQSKAAQQYAIQSSANGGAKYIDQDGKNVEVVACQSVGNKAMYRRNNRWVDPAVTEDEEKKAEKVEQFSDRFFELARNNASLRQYLSLPEGCTVKVEGKVYRVETAAAPAKN